MGIDENQRHGRKQQQCEPGRVVEHEAKAHDGGVDHDDQQDGTHGYEALDQGNVGHRSGHHVAYAEFGKELGALFLQFMEEGLAQIEGYFECHPSHIEPRKADNTVAGYHSTDDAEDRVE